MAYMEEALEVQSRVQELGLRVVLQEHVLIISNALKERWKHLLLD